MSQWQPIETAPKEQDAAPFLGLVSDRSMPGGKRVCTCGPQWTVTGHPIEGGGWLTTGAKFSGYHEFESGAIVPRRVTHWMPMPELPK